MHINILPLTEEHMKTYTRIPITFEVHEKVNVASLQINENNLPLPSISVPPYTKNYDANNPPTNWINRFDCSNWCMLLIEQKKQAIAGAILAFNTPNVNMLQGRDDLVVLWDIRVAPAHRGSGIGTTLFNAAKTWAKEKNCSEIHIETQDTNAAACRFYTKQGCRLIEIDESKYVDKYTKKQETMLLWSIALY